MESFSDQCPVCKTHIEPANKICPNCHTPFEVKSFCGVCGEALSLDWTNCITCKSPLRYFVTEDKKILKSAFIQSNRISFETCDNTVSPQFWMDYRVVNERRMAISKDKVYWDGFVDTDKNIWESKVISNIDSLELMNSLKVSKVILHKGELLLYVSIFDYLLANRLDLLKNIFIIFNNSLSTGIEHCFFIDQFFKGDLIKSQESLDKLISWDNDILSIDPDYGQEFYERVHLNRSGININFYFYSLCQWILFNNKRYVYNSLLEAEEIENWTTVSIERARIYKYLLNLPVECERILKKETSSLLKKHNSRCEQWIDCAINVKEMLSDKTYAKKCVEHACSKAKTTQDFVNIAQVLKEMFFNDTECLYYLDEAEKQAKNIDDWFCIASSRKILFPASHSWKECLLKCENNCDQENKWKDMFYSWIEFNDLAEAKRCIVMLEKDAKVVSEKIKLAKLWKEHFNNDIESKRYILEAENQCMNFDEWIQCYLSWKMIPDSNEDCRRCLTNAEILATDFNDWIKCCKSWLDLSNNKIDAKRCLLIAEKYPDEYIDWATCAFLWGDLGDEERSNVCMLKDTENRSLD